MNFQRDMQLFSSRRKYLLNIQSSLSYKLGRITKQIRPGMEFDQKCQIRIQGQI